MTNKTKLARVRARNAARRAEKKRLEKEREQEELERKQENEVRRRRQQSILLSASARNELERSIVSVQHFNDFEFRSFLKWSNAIICNQDIPSVDLWSSAQVAKKLLALSMENVDFADSRLLIIRSFIVDCLEGNYRRAVQNGLATNKDEVISELVRLLRYIYNSTDCNPGTANEIRLAKLLHYKKDDEEAAQVLSTLYHKRNNTLYAKNESDLDNILYAGVLIFEFFSNGLNLVTADEYNALKKRLEGKQLSVRDYII